MEHVLNFMSDLILFTAGLAVITLWIFMFIEIFDTVSDVLKMLRGQKSTTNPEDQEV